MESFSFHVVRSGPELDAVRALRDGVYRRRLGLVLPETVEEAERDRLGYVFLLRHDGEPIGTARVTPTVCGATELGRLGVLPEGAEHDPQCAEVGRIATIRCKGVNSMTTSPLLLSCSANWLVCHTAIRRYVAYSRPSLVAVWRHMGATDTGVRFVIAERTSIEYGVISGELREVISRTASMVRPLLDQAVGVG